MNEEIKKEEERIRNEMNKLIKHEPKTNLTSNKIKKRQSDYNYKNTLNQDVKRYNNLLKNNPYTSHLKLINVKVLYVIYFIVFLATMFIIINMFWFNISFSDKQFLTAINNTIVCPVKVPVNVSDNQIHNLYNNNSIECKQNITVVNYYNISTC